MSEDLSKKVFKLTGSYPNIGLEEPEQRRSSRAVTRTDKGASFEMEKAVKEESRIFNAWSRQAEGLLEKVRDLFSGEEVTAPMSEEDIALLKKDLTNVQGLGEKHESSLARIQQSQAPSEDVAIQLEHSRGKRATVLKHMKEAEEWICTIEDKGQQQMMAATERRKGEEIKSKKRVEAPPGAARSLSKKSSGKSASRKSTSTRSRNSQKEAIEAKVKFDAAKEKMRLRQKAADRKKTMKVEAAQAAQAAAVAAAVAEAEEQAIDETLEAEEELLEAQARLRCAEQIEALEQE